MKQIFDVILSLRADKTEKNPQNRGYKAQNAICYSCCYKTPMFVRLQWYFTLSGKKWFDLIVNVNPIIPAGNSAQ